MNKEDVRKVVRLTISEILKIPVEVVIESLSIGDMPQWGSMAQMEIIVALQNKFGIKIPMEDLFDLTTVQNMADEVEKLLGK